MMEIMMFFLGMLLGGAICFFACLVAIDEYIKRNKR